MSKFRIKMKLQGFELEIEGSREDASIIGRNIGEQISGMLSPGVSIIDGELTPQHPQMPPSAAIADDTARRRGRRRSKAGSNGSDKDEGQVIEFRHDPSKYGMPNQQWKTAQKAIWLLYTVKEVAGFSELSTGQIVKTFNTHFRQAKTVTASNVSRDLGKLKIATPSLVGEDTTKSPPAWFLTDEGIKFAQTQVANSQAPNAA